MRVGRRVTRPLPLIAAALAAVVVLHGSAGAATATLGVVIGTVLDAETQEPVRYASVAPEDAPARSVLTDERGRFRMAELPLGPHTLHVQHVAYDGRRAFVVLTVTEPRAEIRVELAPSAHLMDPVDVEARRVMPLTNPRTASYTLPRALVQELPIDGFTELVKLVPGVVVSADRPFFRGLGFEHVVPVLDGVALREPLYGEWVLPPPEAIDGTELVAGPFDAALPPALSGVLAVRLAEGGRRPHAHVRYDSDRFDALGGTSMRTDGGELTVSGPTSVDGLYVSGAWKGRMTNTHLAFDHAVPRQELFGFIDGGRRMNGEESASLRLTFLPGVSTDRAATKKLTLTVLHSRSRSKPYRGNYDRSGWVGYEAQFDRYTTFLADTAGVDSVVWYDGPAHVPIAERRSTMLIGAYRSRIGSVALSLNAHVASHDRETQPPFRRLPTIDQVREWIASDVTDEDHQTEWFYATHGDYPAFVDGRSIEAGSGLDLDLPLGAHHLSAGVGGVFGRQRYVGLSGSAPFVAGSFDDDVRTFDGHVYVQDVIATDPLSSFQVGVRMDTRHIDGYLGSATATVFSPRIGFRQPMTDVDAIHVQAGAFHQFPGYATYFPPSILSESDPEPLAALTAQRTRAFEVGIQHHVSAAIVVYATSYVRASNAVVFAAREPSELDLLFGHVAPAADRTFTSRGVELTVDHHLHPALRGQASVTFGKTTLNDRETPWSRTSTARTWLSYHPFSSLRVSAAAFWDSGRPYAACIKPRGDCLESELYTGRLPDTFTVDLGVRWSLDRDRHVRLVADVRNVFDRRVPTFDFGVARSNVRVENFIAYYDETNEPGGYTVDTNTSVFRRDVDNAETETQARNARLGLMLSF